MTFLVNYLFILRCKTATENTFFLTFINMIFFLSLILSTPSVLCYYHKHIKKALIYIHQTLYLWELRKERWFPVLVHCILKIHHGLGKFIHTTANFIIKIICVVEGLILLVLVLHYCKLGNGTLKM